MSIKLSGDVIIHGGKAIARGFTLLELLVAVLILGILAAFAVPAYTGLVERNRLGTISSKFEAALQRGHSEAVRQNRPVVIRSIANGSQQWAGWTVLFLNLNGTDDAEIIRNEGVLPANLEIEEEISAATEVEIRADGEVERTYQFTMTDTVTTQCRRLVFYPTGTVRVIENCT